jgi:hypothetical protein
MLPPGALYRCILEASQISVEISPQHPVVGNNCYSGTQHLWQLTTQGY